MKATFKKANGGLFPDSPEAEKLFKKIETDAMVECIKGRNYRNLKRFFELRNVTFDIQDCFECPEIWRKHLIMLGGHFETVVIPTQSPLMNWIAKSIQGLPVPDVLKNPILDRIEKEPNIQYWPKSINFEEMGELEFQELFSRCVTAFLSRYGRGMTEQDFLKVLEFD